MKHCMATDSEPTSSKTYLQRTSSHIRYKGGRPLKDILINAKLWEIKSYKLVGRRRESGFSTPKDISICQLEDLEIKIGLKLQSRQICYKQKMTVNLGPRIERRGLEQWITYGGAWNGGPRIGGGVGRLSDMGRLGYGKGSGIVRNFQTCHMFSQI